MTSYPPATPEPGPPRGRDYWAARPPWYALLAGGGIFVILVVVLAILLRDDSTEIQTVAPTLTTDASTSSTDVAQTTSTDPSSTSAASTSTSTTGSSSSSTTTSTTAATTTTTAASTTTTSATTTTTEDPAAYASAMWPWFDSSLRYRDPVDAARGFAEDYVGFSQPVVGPFLQGDGRSGEVEITPTDDGPVTTVFVRQLGPSSTWWVLGAVTENTEIEEPDALDVIDSPVVVSGKALAFEGVVDVEIRSDGTTTPLFTGIVTGGGTELRPFREEFTWTNPGDGAGAVVLLTTSMDDNRVWTVSAVRVAFAAG